MVLTGSHARDDRAHVTTACTRRRPQRADRVQSVENLYRLIYKFDFPDRRP